MEFIQSNKGKPKLCYEGFMYTRKTKSKSTIRWECTKRRGDDCPGKLSTNTEETAVIPGSKIAHNHREDNFEIAATKVRKEIQRNASTFRRGTPMQILTDVVTAQPIEVRLALGDTESKTQSIYEELLTAVLNKSEELGLSPDPLQVTLDFEQTMMNAVSATLGRHVQVHGCFYHLTQATWRKMQELGLSVRYREEEDLKHFCGMLDGLAFLPMDDVPEGMDFIRQNVPDGLDNLVDYFDSTYVTGSYRRVRGPAADGPVRIRRVPPRFPALIWNVNEITLADQPRTNNLCEGWNNSFASLVGQATPSVWTVLSALQKDMSMAITDIQRIERGEQPKKRMRKTSKQLQTRLKNLCVKYRNGETTLPQFMTALGHCIRF